MSRGILSVSSLAPVDGQQTDRSHLLPQRRPADHAASSRGRRRRYHAENTLPTGVFTERIECALWLTYYVDRLDHIDVAFLAPPAGHLALGHYALCRFSPAASLLADSQRRSFKFCYFIITHVTVLDRIAQCAACA